MLGHPQGRELLIVAARAVAADQRGLTLIELMITIAIGTTLAMMALPMYSTWIASQQVRTAAESVYEGIRVAQTEAVRRNNPIAFELAPATGWTVKLVSDDSVLRETKLIEGSPNVEVTVAPANATTVIFDGLGRALDDAQSPLAARITIDVKTKTGFTDARAQRVIIDTAAATGVGIRSCDPQLPTGDPRACPA